MSTDRPTLTPETLTVDEATLVREHATLVRLDVDGHLTIETAAPTDLVRLLCNTVEGRGYRLVASTIPPDRTGDMLAGTLTAETIREDTITLRERFVPQSIRLLAGLLAAIVGTIGLATTAADLAVIALLLGGFAIASPYADSQTPAIVTYPVQLDLSITSEPADTLADPSVPTDSRFSRHSTPSVVTVDIVSYAPFVGVAESALDDDVEAVIEALRGFDDA